MGGGRMRSRAVRDAAAAAAARRRSVTVVIWGNSPKQRADVDVCKTREASPGTTAWKAGSDHRTHTGRHCNGAMTVNSIQPLASHRRRLRGIAHIWLRSVAEGWR